MKTTTISLKQFCSSDDKREALWTPFSQGEWTFATDGRIIIRIRRVSWIDERDNAPKNILESVWNHHPNTGKFVPLSELGDIPKYKDLVKCENCDGTGRCTRCKCGDDHACGVCGGSGDVPEKAIGVPFGKHMVSHLYLNLIKDHLPNPMLAESSVSARDGIGIRFDGGEGILMPLNPDAQ